MSRCSHAKHSGFILNDTDKKHFHWSFLVALATYWQSHLLSRKWLGFNKLSWDCWTAGTLQDSLLLFSHSQSPLGDFWIIHARTETLGLPPGRTARFSRASSFVWMWPCCSQQAARASLSHIPDTGTPLPCRDVHGTDIQARCTEPAWIGIAGTEPELIRLARPEVTPAVMSAGSQVRSSAVPSPGARSAGKQGTKRSLEPAAFISTSYPSAMQTCPGILLFPVLISSNFSLYLNHPGL